MSTPFFKPTDTIFFGYASTTPTPSGATSPTFIAPIDLNMEAAQNFFESIGSGWTWNATPNNYTVPWVVYDADGNNDYSPVASDEIQIGNAALLPQPVKFLVGDFEVFSVNFAAIAEADLISNIAPGWSVTLVAKSSAYCFEVTPYVLELTNSTNSDISIYANFMPGFNAIDSSQNLSLSEDGSYYTLKMNSTANVVPNYTDPANSTPPITLIIEDPQASQFQFTLQLPLNSGGGSPSMYYNPSATAPNQDNFKLAGSSTFIAPVAPKTTNCTDPTFMTVEISQNYNLAFFNRSGQGYTVTGTNLPQGTLSVASNGCTGGLDGSGPNCSSSVQTLVVSTLADLTINCSNLFNITASFSQNSDPIIKMANDQIGGGCNGSAPPYYCAAAKFDGTTYTIYVNYIAGPHTITIDNTDTQNTNFNYTIEIYAPSSALTSYQQAGGSGTYPPIPFNSGESSCIGALGKNGCYQLTQNYSDPSLPLACTQCTGATKSQISGLGFITIYGYQNKPTASSDPVFWMVVDLSNPISGYLAETYVIAQQNVVASGSYMGGPYTGIDFEITIQPPNLLFWNNTPNDIVMNADQKALASLATITPNSSGGITIPTGCNLTNPSVNPSNANGLCYGLIGDLLNQNKVPFSVDGSQICVLDFSQTPIIVSEISPGYSIDINMNGVNVGDPATPTVNYSAPYSPVITINYTAPPTSSFTVTNNTELTLTPTPTYTGTQTFTLTGAGTTPPPFSTTFTLDFNGNSTTIYQDAVTIDLDYTTNTLTINPATITFVNNTGSVLTLNPSSTNTQPLFTSGITKNQIPTGSTVATIGSILNDPSVAVTLPTSTRTTLFNLVYGTPAAPTTPVLGASYVVESNNSGTGGYIITFNLAPTITIVNNTPIAFTTNIGEADLVDPDNFNFPSGATAYSFKGILFNRELPTSTPSPISAQAVLGSSFLTDLTTTGLIFSNPYISSNQKEQYTLSISVDLPSQATPNGVSTSSGITITTSYNSITRNYSFNIASQSINLINNLPYEITFQDTVCKATSPIVACYSDWNSFYNINSQTDGNGCPNHTVNGADVCLTKSTWNSWTLTPATITETQTVSPLNVTANIGSFLFNQPTSGIEFVSSGDKGSIGSISLIFDPTQAGSITTQSLNIEATVAFSSANNEWTVTFNPGVVNFINDTGFDITFTGDPTAFTIPFNSNGFSFENSTYTIGSACTTASVASAPCVGTIGTIFNDNAVSFIANDSAVLTYDFTQAQIPNILPSPDLTTSLVPGYVLTIGTDTPATTYTLTFDLYPTLFIDNSTNDSFETNIESSQITFLSSESSACSAWATTIPALNALPNCIAILNPTIPFSVSSFTLTDGSAAATQFPVTLSYTAPDTGSVSTTTPNVAGIHFSGSYAAGNPRRFRIVLEPASITFTNNSSYTLEMPGKNNAFTSSTNEFIQSPTCHATQSNCWQVAPGKTVTDAAIGSFLQGTSGTTITFTGWNSAATAAQVYTFSIDFTTTVSPPVTYLNGQVTIAYTQATAQDPANYLVTVSDGSINFANNTTSAVSASYTGLATAISIPIGTANADTPIGAIFNQSAVTFAPTGGSEFLTMDFTTVPPTAVKQSAATVAGYWTAVTTDQANTNEYQVAINQWPTVVFNNKTTQTFTLANASGLVPQFLSTEAPWPTTGIGSGTSSAGILDPSKFTTTAGITLTDSVISGNTFSILAVADPTKDSTTYQNMGGTTAQISYKASSMQYSVTLQPATIVFTNSTNYTIEVPWTSNAFTSGITQASSCSGTNPCAQIPQSVTATVGTALDANNTINFRGYTTTGTSVEVVNFSLTFDPTKQATTTNYSTASVTLSVTTQAPQAGATQYSVSIAPASITFTNNTPYDLSFPATDATAFQSGITASSGNYTVAAGESATGVIGTLLNDGALTFSAACSNLACGSFSGSVFSVNFAGTPASQAPSGALPSYTQIDAGFVSTIPTASDQNGGYTLTFSIQPTLSIINKIDDSFTISLSDTTPEDINFPVCTTPWWPTIPALSTSGTPATNCLAVLATDVIEGTFTLKDNNSNDAQKVFSNVEFSAISASGGYSTSEGGADLNGTYDPSLQRYYLTLTPPYVQFKNTTAYDIYMYAAGDAFYSGEITYTTSCPYSYQSNGNCWIIPANGLSTGVEPVINNLLAETGAIHFVGVADGTTKTPIFEFDITFAQNTTPTLDDNKNITVTPNYTNPNYFVEIDSPTLSIVNNTSQSVTITSSVTGAQFAPTNCPSGTSPCAITVADLLNASAASFNFPSSTPQSPENFTVDFTSETPTSSDTTNYSFVVAPVPAGAGTNSTGNEITIFQYYHVSITNSTTYSFTYSYSGQSNGFSCAASGCIISDTSFTTTTMQTLTLTLGSDTFTASISGDSSTTTMVNFTSGTTPSKIYAYYSFDPTSRIYTIAIAAETISITNNSSYAFTFGSDQNAISSGCTSSGCSVSSQATATGTIGTLLLSSNSVAFAAVDSSNHPLSCGMSFTLDMSDTSPIAISNQLYVSVTPTYTPATSTAPGSYTITIDNASISITNNTGLDINSNASSTDWGYSSSLGSGVNSSTLGSIFNDTKTKPIKFYFTDSTKPIFSIDFTKQKWTLPTVSPGYTLQPTDGWGYLSGNATLTLTIGLQPTIVIANTSDFDLTLSYGNADASDISGSCVTAATCSSGTGTCFTISQKSSATACTLTLSGAIIGASQGGAIPGSSQPSVTFSLVSGSVSSSFASAFTFNAPETTPVDQYLYGVDLNIGYNSPSLQYAITLTPATISIPVVSNFPYNLSIGSEQSSPINLATGVNLLPIGTLISSSEKNAVSFYGFNSSKAEVFSFDVDFSDATNPVVSNNSNVNASALFASNVYTITVSPTPVYFINNTGDETTTHASEEITIKGSVSGSQPFSVTSIPACPTGSYTCSQASSVIQGAFNDSKVQFSTPTLNSSFTMDFTQPPPISGSSSNLEYKGSCVWNTPAQTPPGQVCTITYKVPTYTFDFTSPVTLGIGMPNDNSSFIYVDGTTLNMNFSIPGITVDDWDDFLVNASSTEINLSVGTLFSLVLTQSGKPIQGETGSSFIISSGSYNGVDIDVNTSVKPTVMVSFTIDGDLSVTMVSGSAGIPLSQTPKAVALTSALSGTLTIEDPISSDDANPITQEISPITIYSYSFAITDMNVTPNASIGENTPGLVNGNQFKFVFALSSETPIPPAINLSTTKPTTVTLVNGNTPISTLTIGSVANSDGSYPVTGAGVSAATATFSQGTNKSDGTVATYSTLTISGIETFTVDTTDALSGVITLNFAS